MTAYVVDENVPIVANDANRTLPKAPQADNACRLECVRALRAIVKGGCIAIIDDDGEILASYRRHLSGAGQPGVGDAFLKYLSDQQYNRRRVRRTPLAKNDVGEFEGFPSDPALASFDPSDRIFVALACVAPEHPIILNAVDSDYIQHFAALLRAGVRVKELCPHCVHG